MTDDAVGQSARQSDCDMPATTDDIVDRLRLAAKPEEWASVWGLTVVRCSLLRDAADEIERLRVQIRKPEVAQ